MKGSAMRVPRDPVALAEPPSPRTTETLLHKTIPSTSIPWDFAWQLPETGEGEDGDKEGGRGRRSAPAACISQLLFLS